MHIFGGGRTSSGVLALMTNLTGLQGKYEKIGKLSGSFGAQAAAQAKTMAAQWAIMKSTLESAGVVIGDDLIPLVKDVAHDVTDITGAFDRLSPATQKWIVKLGLAAAALGPLAQGVGVMGQVSGAASSFMALRMLKAGLGAGASTGALPGAMGSARVAAAAEMTGAAVVPLPVVMVGVSAVAAGLLAGVMVEHFAKPSAEAKAKAAAEKHGVSVDMRTGRVVSGAGPSTGTGATSFIPGAGATCSLT